MTFFSTGITFISPDLITALGLLAAAGVCFVLITRGVAKRGGKVLFSLRLAMLLCFTVLLLQPELVRYSQEKKPVLAFAVDVSPSMSLTGRLPLLRRFIEENIQKLAGDFTVKLYAFSSGAQEIESADALAAAPRTHTTDLNRSLWEIRREQRGNLAGILLLSDGNHTADPLPQRWSAGLNTPVFPCAPGIGKKVKDLALHSVRVSDFAFKDTPIEVAASASFSGFAGTPVIATLSAQNAEKPGGSDILASRTVTPLSDNDSQEIVLRFTPQSAGEFRYTVALSPQPGELTTANNRRSFLLETVREKLRVLFLCGQPGPEYAFLRHALKNDPLVELISFVILRNPENIALVPENDLALIPFPVNDLFTRDLSTFDVIILQNFTYQRFGFLPEYLVNIQKWVTEKGGGLIMTGGENSFGKGGWADSPVAAILPVLPDSPLDSFENGLFRPTCENLHHFLTRIDDDPEKNKTFWNAVPELESCQKLQDKKGADILLRHPSSRAVVLAAWQRGKGRVAAFGSPTSWRWSLQSSTPEGYTRFWKNMVRYLAGMGQAKTLHVTFDRPDYSAHDPFSVKVRASTNADSTSVTVALFDPSGKKTLVPMARIRENEWGGRGTFTDTGIHRFQITLQAGGVPVTQELFQKSVALSALREESLLDINEQLLKEIAAASGGSYFPSLTSFSSDKLRASTKKLMIKTVKEKKPLWAAPWLFGIMAGLLFAEWLLRKRKGLC